jgi:hypothetical protein
VKELHPTPIVRAVEDLATLAAAINRCHAEGERLTHRGLEHYRKAGEALLKAKAQCGHGKWLKWVEKNLTCTDRQARRYMALAKSDTVSDLESRWRIITGRESADLAADEPEAARPAGPRPGYKSIFEWEEESRHGLMYWFDQQEKHTLFLDALGWDVPRIAAWLGVTTASTEAILHPIPPRRFDTERNGAGLIEPASLQPQCEAAYRDTVRYHLAFRISTLTSSARGLSPAKAWAAWYRFSAICWALCWLDARITSKTRVWPKTAFWGSRASNSPSVKSKTQSPGASITSALGVKSSPSATPRGGPRLSS